MYSIQGKLRKNSRTYNKTIQQFETEEEVLEYLKRNNLINITKPYIFTHLKIEDNNQIITQSCQGIICSPQKLAGKLGYLLKN